MIRRLIRRIKIPFDPPKVGDIYYGDPFDFICGSPFEHVLHRTKSIYGDPIWNVVASDGCYRLTIESESMPYYRCKAEVLCENVHGYGKEWLERVQPRRISKDRFREMIIDGRIKRGE
jgi:hypothetical protein